VKSLITASVAIQAAVAAARDYADIVTDRDPDDGEHVVPGELRRFMARLRLLHGVPFSYLVPDAKLLPIESIRFFYIDRAWTDALVQGALSVGTITSADRTQLEAVYPHIRAEVDEAERSVRQPRDEAQLKAGSGTLTGFIMRSRVVSGWPNLHVRAYARDLLPDDALTTVSEADPSRMKVLRLERLAPAVLFVLFDGVPAVVHIEEPRQGIQFGARLDRNDPPANRRAKVHVRDCNTGDLVAPKNTLTEANSVEVPFRSGAPGVIDITTLRQRIAAKPLTNSGGSLEPNEYALQMLRFPYRQVFGDPKDLEGQKFFDLDRFKATVGLTQWKATVTSALGRVNP
jgi:hypothetical protein